MNVVVIGYGSIGARHVEVLSGMGHRVSVVSARQVEGYIRFATVRDALHSAPDYVVVANRTNRHFDTLRELRELGCRCTILVEKPLFHADVALPEETEGVFVAYNLRYHPVLLRLRELLAGKRVLSIQAYVGQYLPQWRPGTDYRCGYSARREEGGGVLRDLSHELDYLTWIFGRWRRVAALGGKFSHLEIDSDDVVAALLVLERCPLATVQLNYLDRVARRTLLINTDSCSIEADLLKGTLRINDQTESFLVELNLTYERQHRALLSGAWDLSCSFQEGVQVNRLIDATERSIALKEWVTNE